MMKLLQFCSMVVLLQSIVAAVHAQEQLENREGEFVTLGNQTFFFNSRLESGVPVLNATRICNDLAMKLISFETEDKWTLLQDYMNFAGYSNRYTWTSARRYHDSWLWTGIGQEIKYFSWGEEQPRNLQDADCIIAMSLAQWFDTKCEGLANYICEY